MIAKTNEYTSGHGLWLIAMGTTVGRDVVWANV